MKIKIIKKNKVIGEVTAITTLEGGQVIATLVLNNKGKAAIADPKEIPEVFTSTPAK